MSNEKSIVATKIGDVITFSIPNVYTSSYTSEDYYMVDGIRVASNTRYQTKEFSKVEFVHFSREVDFYKNKEGKRMKVVDYDNKKDSLYEKYDNETESWDSLDTEFEYRKFKANWEAVYMEKREVTEVHVDIVERPKSQYPEIQPLATLGKDDWSDPLCTFQPDLQAYFRKSAKKYGFEELPYDTGYSQTKGAKFSFHRKDSLEFTTINNGFAPDNISKIHTFYRGSYEDMVAKRTEIVNKIDNYLREVSNVINSVAFDREAVLVRVERIHKAIAQVQTKGRTADEYNAALKASRELVAALKDLSI